MASHKTGYVMTSQAWLRDDVTQDWRGDDIAQKNWLYDDVIQVWRDDDVKRD